MNAVIKPDVKQILLATDFSQWTTQAVDFAFYLARCFGADVYMVHGIEPIANVTVEDEEEDEEDSDFDEFFGELIEKSTARLEELVIRAEEQGVSARFHIEIGQRWRIVLDQAESEDVDLIIMGRRAYKDHQDLSLGTTSQRVYFGSSRPVLTVPSENDQQVEKEEE